MLLMVVPLAAVTTPRMVTLQTPPPSIVAASQVTWVLIWLHEPRLLTTSSSGGFPRPTTPLIWSVRWTLSTLAPPVFETVTVYRIWPPDWTGSGLSMLVIVSGPAATTGATIPSIEERMSADPSAAARRPLIDDRR